MNTVKNATTSSQAELVKASVILTFANQQLLNLWENEFEGQISDGMWENSKTTKWLWENTATCLGEVTKVETTNLFIDGKRNYPMSKELCSIVGERATAESGFESVEAMKKGWKEISDAIRNARFNQDLANRREAARKTELEELALSADRFREDLIKDGFQAKFSFSYSKVVHEMDGKEVRIIVDPTTWKAGRVQVTVEHYGSMNNVFNKSTIFACNISSYATAVVKFCKSYSGEE